MKVLLFNENIFGKTNRKTFTFNTQSGVIAYPTTLKGGSIIETQMAMRFPDHALMYRAACQNDEIKIGRVYMYDTELLDTNELYNIICMPIKRTANSYVSLEFVIRHSLSQLANHISFGITQHVAMPFEFGEHETKDVLDLIKEIFRPINSDCELHIYDKLKRF